MSQKAGVARYERRDTRTTYRNSYREWTWRTRVSEIALRIPKLQGAAPSPACWNCDGRQSGRWWRSCNRHTCREGARARWTSLSLSGTDKSTVLHLCRDLDAVVEQFRQRPLEGAYPHLWLDALYLKVRQSHRNVSQAVIIVEGMRETGECQVLGFAVGARE